MIKSVKKTKKEIAMPFSSMALAERQFATEIIEINSIRLIPTIRFKFARLKIKNASHEETHEFKENDRITLNLSDYDDGVYYYELILVIQVINNDKEKYSNETAHLKGKFVMHAGFSREFNSKWLSNQK